MPQAYKCTRHALQAHCDSICAKAFTEFLLAGHEILSDFLEVVVHLGGKGMPRITDFFNDRIFQ